ncbi:MAG: fimbrillin family protein [Alistipes sp.]|uniref:fimbrillin family protein n=1 Tax=Alistipes sp. TaxID=1872444 RepID=UPI0025C63D4A|nr:fimbrillin family protein [Alistipes sp.]MCD8275965.1 fimbrillin family protein [Alistipes sp.]
MKIRFYTAAAALLILAACNNDEMNDPLADGPVAAQVTAGISRTMTHVGIDKDGGPASFSTGDRINVVAAGTQTHAYTLQTDGTWQAGDDPYYFQDRNSVTFRGWYADPSVTAEDNKISIDTKTQEYNDANGWNLHDILVTPKVSTTVSEPSISFTGDNAFRHIMSQLVFTFEKGDGIPDLSKLTGYTLKDVVTTVATFNTQTLELTNGSTSGDIAVTGIEDVTGKEYEASPIILVPQEFTSSQLTLEVTYNEQTYTATLNLPEGNQLQPGYSYTYTVAIKNSELEIGNVQIKDWSTNPMFNGNGNATLQ